MNNKKGVTRLCFEMAFAVFFSLLSVNVIAQSFTNVTPPANSADAVSIGNRVFLDVNNNGLQDAPVVPDLILGGPASQGDPGFSSAVVHLLNSSDELVNQTLTDTYGQFSFRTDSVGNLLPPGDYKLEFVLPAGLSFASLNVGSDSQIDSDANTSSGQSAQFTLTAGQQNFSIDAGLVSTVPACLVGNDDIGGNVFRDFNLDGSLGAAEPGFGGILVQAFNVENTLVAATTSLPDGTYNFAGLAATGAIRLEFSGLPDFVLSGAAGGTAGSLVQHITAATCSVNAAVGNPAQYCQIEPEMVSPVQSNGDSATGNGSINPAMKSFSYNSYGQHAPGPTAPGNFQLPSAPENLAVNSDLGSTWGVAYHKQTDQLFVSAFMKRHSTFGPLGTGGIYKIDVSGLSPVTSQFLDLNQGGINTGADIHNIPAGANLDTPSIDAAAFDAVGKSSLGDIDFSEDGNTLWVVNLEEKTLLEIPVGASATAPAISDIVEHQIPDPQCNAGEYRPFGIEIHDGVVYVGGVCDAQNGGGQDDLDAHIYIHDPQGPDSAFDHFFEVNVGFDRGCASTFDLGATGGGCDGFQPWISSWNAADPSSPVEVASFYVYPQPMLTDIEIDIDGSLVLGLADRFGSQAGYRNLDTLGQGLVSAVSAGDILRICNVDGTFIAEGFPGCQNPTRGGVGNPNANGEGNASPGSDGQEFYFDDVAPSPAFGFHQESALGGLAFMNGSGEIVTNVTDPLNVWSGGVSWLDMDEGNQSTRLTVGNLPSPIGQNPNQFARRYQLFEGINGTGNGGQPVTGTGKNGGLGDLEVLCETPPLSIGNYVWRDDDRDGVQDPNEPPLNNIEVQLFEWNDDGNGDFVASELGSAVMFNGAPVTATTSANGGYYFGHQGGNTAGNNDVNASDEFGFVGGAGLDENTKYIVLISRTTTINNASADNAQLENAFGVSPTGGITGSLATNDEHDSDGQSGLITDSVIASVMTGAGGSNDHMYDFGFYGKFSLGSTLWSDLNADGIQDDEEPAIQGAIITLLNADGSQYDNDLITSGIQSLTTTSDSSGQYNFNDLRPGDYRIQADLSPIADGFIVWGTQVVDANNNDNTDSNIDVGFDTNSTDEIHFSGIISLDHETSEPLTESDPIGASGTNPDQPNQTVSSPDGNGNMTLDLGFVQPLSLGSSIWVDENSNGIQDDDEAPIVNASIQLLNADGSVFDADPFAYAEQSLTVLTDADGQYNFNNLPAGSYRVLVDITDATNLNVSNFLPTPIQVLDANTNENNDSNIDSANLANNPVNDIWVSASITLSLGAEPTNEVDPIGVAANASTLDQPNQTFSPKNQPDANGNMTLDLGFIDPVSLGSTVWFDGNGNGTQDAGEPAIIGATATLLNSDGSVFDSDPNTVGDQAFTSVTNNEGQYNFNGLPPGSFIVQIDTSSVTSHNGTALSPSLLQIANPNDNNNSDSNIASNPSANLFQSGVIELSPGDEPESEVDVIATAGDDQPNQTATEIDANGNMTVDFGFFLPVSVGSTIWEDANLNGNQDTGEAPLIGVTATLLNANGSVYDSDTTTAGIQVLTSVTDANGQYNFNGLPPGDYRIQVDLSTASNGTDYLPTLVQVADPDAAGDDNMDSNIDLAFDTDTSDSIHTSGIVSLASGGEPINETDPIGSGASPTTPDQPNQGLTTTDDPDNSGNMTVDLGFYKAVSLGSQLWLDDDIDGRQDGGEPAIVGAVVTLLNADGTPYDSDSSTPDVQPLTIASDSMGEYNFNNLPEGDYRVKVDLSTAIVSGSSTVIDLIASPNQTANPNNDNNTDSNIDESVTSSSVGTNAGDALNDSMHTSGVITLSVGDEPRSEVSFLAGAADQPGQGVNDLDANGNMTLDMGFVPAVSLGSTLWLDADGDGIQEVGESPIAGATVTLLDGSGNPVDGDPATTGVQPITTLSNADGEYVFNGLPENDYMVEVDTSTVTSVTGLVASPVQVSDPENDVNSDSNIASSASIDVFRSGIVTLSVGDEPATEVDPIGAGTTVSTPDQPSQTGSQPDTNGNMTVDFGFVVPVSIGSVIWEDDNGDGIQDASEDPIAGAVVTLLVDDGTGTFVSASDVDGNPVASVTTVADGLYEFENLFPGDYKVQVTPPSDYEPSPTQNTANNDDTENDSNIASEPIAGTYESGVFTLESGNEPNEVDTERGDTQDGTAGSIEDLSGNNTVDFGFVVPVSIGSAIWEDDNGDGIQDATEDPVSGVVVELLVNDGAGNFFPALDLEGNAVESVTTGDDGLYEFEDLPPGDYVVQITPPSTFVASPEQNVTSNDDTENDSNIASEPTAGVYQSAVFTLESGNEPNEADTFDGDTQDGASGDLDDLSGNETIDFGLIVPVSIGSYVWEDDNGNGLQDVGEDPIAGAVVALLVDDGTGNFVPATDLTGAVVANVSTATDGLYVFDNLAPGDYKVQVTPVGNYVPTTTQNTASNDDTENDSNIASEPTTGTYESGVFTLESGNEPNEADTEAGDAQEGTLGSLEDLSGNMTVDFGFVSPISIGSYVWEDDNGDGLQDVTEDPINGALVELLVDDGSGNFVPAVDVNGTPVASVTTGVDGLYEFELLPPGDYVVEMTPPADYIAGPVQNTSDDDDTTTDSNIASEPTPGTYQSGVFTLESGNEPNEGDTEVGDNQDGAPDSMDDLSGNHTIDFAVIAPVSIGSVIWEDNNIDGVQAANEDPIAGVLVSILVDDGAGNFVSTTDVDGNPVTSVTTGADGLYEFENLFPGDYKVQVTPPADYEPSPTQNTASNDDTENDSNIASEPTAGTYESGVFTLESGNEPNEADTELGDTQDGASGSIDDLSGNNTVDFGFVLPISVGSAIWEDANGDGIQDANEDPIQGAVVTLLVDDGTGNFVQAIDLEGNPVTSVTTSTDGLYEFEDLPTGDYVVQVTPPANFVPSPVQNSANDDDTENDSNIASEPTTGTYQSGVFTLEPGNEPIEADTFDGDAQDGVSGGLDDLSGNETIDFGFITPLSMGSYVWDDLNGDGVQDANEPSLAGAVVTLLVDDGMGNFIPVTDLSGSPVTSVTTGPDGLYVFDNLAPGDYKVQVTPPAGYFPSGVQNGADNDDTEGDSNIAGEPSLGTFESGAFTLESGNEPIEGSERGDDQDTSAPSFDASGNMTVDFGFTRPASIGDRVWIDLDQDGVQDANEDPLVGVTVTLTPPSTIDLGNGPGVPIMTMTNANGNYLFPDLPPFTDSDPTVGYVVSVDPSTLPTGYEQTYDEGDGVGATDHTSAPIQLVPDDFHDTADFGYVPEDGSIGDTIWVDADGDGVQDPSEQGIVNVTVTLTPAPDVDLGNGPGEPIITTTDENGKYLFPNLPLDETFIVTVDESTLPIGYTSDPDGDGDPDVRDGNSTTADGVTVITLTPDSPVNLDADFGYLPPEDQNNSVIGIVGITPEGPGSDECVVEGLPEIAVSLSEQGSLDMSAETVTDSEGEFAITGVPDGVYVLNIVAGQMDDLTPPELMVIDLDSGSIEVEPVVYRDLCVQFFDPVENQGAIGDTVFFDADSDGQPDEGEGIQGVIVELYDSSDNLIDSTTTDANGNYVFNDLPVSPTGETYKVVVDTNTLPNGGTDWINTVDPDGTNDSTSVVTLTDARPVDIDQDFGYESEGENSITGTVWSDSDGDGMQEEAGTFEGVTVELRDEDGDVIQTTTTDADGNYEFQGLPDGIYVVIVTDEDNVLNSYEHTDSPNGSNDTSDQTSKDDTGYTVDLDSAGNTSDPVADVTGDFGYEPVVTNPISLASFKSVVDGDEVSFTWATQTEVSNLGFNLYAQVNGSWQRLNDNLIQGKGDSVTIRTYTATYDIDASYFAVADVDIFGKETLHGPFKLGEVKGVEAKPKSTEWPVIGADNLSDIEVERQAKKLDQMKHRNQILKQAQ